MRANETESQQAAWYVRLREYDPTRRYFETSKEGGGQYRQRCAKKRIKRIKERNRSKSYQCPLEVTIDEAIKIMSKWEKNSSDCEPTKSASDTVLIYYANSGYFRFVKFNEYCHSKNGKTVDEKALKEELLDEKLNNKELFWMIKQYFDTHPFNRQFFSCAI